MDHVPGCVFDAKPEFVRNLGANGWRAAIPDQAIAAGQGRHSRSVIRLVESWSGAASVVTFERRAGDWGQWNFGSGCFGKTVFVDDVAVERIGAGGHRGQRLGERGWAGAVGVQVPDEIHARNAKHVEVHHMPVVGQQVVSLPG